MRHESPITNRPNGLVTSQAAADANPKPETLRTNVYMDRLRV